MERHVKERLIGAAVLMAAAIILVPEMLSGPPEQKHAEAPRPAGETPVKTYTIDLSQSSAQTSGQDVPDTRAPPNEMPPPAEDDAGGETADAAPQADPESTNVESAAQVASTAGPEVKTAAPPVVPAPAPVTREAAAPVAPAPAPKTAVATSEPAPKSQGGWAVQLGSFSSKATADRLSAEWRDTGYDAFVMPVKTNGATLYRVRIGPMPTREQADATLRKVKGKVPGAAVVAHR